jgi:CheY-like chemotaxis protein
MAQGRILVIEDEAGIRALMQKVLEPAYEVRLAERGQDGLNQARWFKPDVILLDIRMPGVDGLTVLAKLKAQPETRMIPVVIVSGRGDTEVLLEGQRAGAVDHIIKPFTPEDLLNVIERQLGMSSS